MQFQIGKNPEFTFSVCFNAAWYSSAIALPLNLTWWYSNDIQKNKHIDISVTILCFRFGLEIWFWNKKEKNNAK